MTLYCYFWKLEVDENNLIYRNLFGKTKVFMIEEIEIKTIRTGYRIYKKK